QPSAVQGPISPSCDAHVRPHRLLRCASPSGRCAGGPALDSDGGRCVGLFFPWLSSSSSPHLPCGAPIPSHECVTVCSTAYLVSSLPLLGPVVRCVNVMQSCPCRSSSAIRLRWPMSPLIR